MQEALKEKQLKPVQEVSTRWNSTYLMIKCLVKIQHSIRSVMVNENSLQESELTNGEWNRLEYLRALLEPFHTATELLGAELRPTLSTFFPILRALQKHAAHDKWKSSATIQRVAEDLRFNLAIRWPCHPER